MGKILIRSRAPLRLGMAGGGTDVSPYAEEFGGAVLNATINRYVYTTIEFLSEKKVIFESLDRGLREEYEATEKLEHRPGLILHSGVYNRLVKDYNAGKPLSVKVSTYSQAPAGSGLGASSTLVVSMLGAFQAGLGLPFGEYEQARLAWEIERIDLGLEGGRQDQYAATFGGFNFMEFSNREQVIVNPLRIDQVTLRELEYSLILYYTGTSRLSSEIIAEQAKNVRNKKQQSVDAMHKLKEQAYEMKTALLRGDFMQLGAILDKGWEHKRHMAEGISNQELDGIYRCAKQAGATGGKVTGAGGGGFFMFFAPGTSRHAVEDALHDLGGEVSSLQFSSSGLETWQVKE